LTDEERVRVQELIRSPKTSSRLATRARIVLALDENPTLKVVAQQVGVSLPTVALWRKRFLESRVDGLLDRRTTRVSDSELERLLDAAERAVSRRGFCATRLADIAEEAGVSASLIMYYLGSHEDALVRAMLHANQRASAELGRHPIAGGGSALERLKTFVERVLPDEGSQLDEYLLELDLLAHARQHPDFVAAWDEHQGRWIDNLASIIRDGVADDVMRCGDIEPRELAQQVLALVDGYGYQLAIGSALVTRASMRRSMARYIADQLGLRVEDLVGH